MSKREKMSEELKPVAWQFYQDDTWHTGMDINDHRKNTEEAGYPVRNLYAIPENCVLIPVGDLKAAIRLMRATGSNSGWHEKANELEAIITAAQEEQQP
ncbi:hypothetical protein [Marinobacterium litorale]|uniref:hypothetical protein n=1 Tax=Marinobacterium litorale TaxID=404770 RepID=UPI0003FE9231|nr:hypothetical protein [Marinobacterium litorale]